MNDNAHIAQEQYSDRQAANKSPCGKRITDSLLDHVGTIAEECGATAIFVYVDAIKEETLSLPDNLKDKVFYVSKTLAELEHQEELGKACIRVPDVPLSRMSQIKIAIFTALSRKLIKPSDVIVCLSGLAASGTLDTIVVMNVGQEFEMFSVSPETKQLPPDVQPEVIERVIDLASELGSEGREGKPVGTLFIIGDTEKVLSLSDQLILNPFHGYHKKERNILNPAIEETVKELSTIDGAFVIRGDGIIESAGVYLKSAGQTEYSLPQGLGARHHAAAAITNLTESIAVAVSESTGSVTVFQGGKIIVAIEKLRGTGQRRTKF